ncbi:MAG: hypothetical protein M1835_004630 [Candelina submexicana]|nr:MAG: hypothetical protein M1835_004630 [Candelina submexicana]
MGQSWASNGSEPKSYSLVRDFFSARSRSRYSTPPKINGLSPSALGEREVFESPQTGVQGNWPQLDSSNDGYDSDEDTDNFAEKLGGPHGNNDLSPSLSVTQHSPRQKSNDLPSSQYEHTPRGRRTRRWGSPYVLPATALQYQHSRDTSLDDYGLPPSSQIPRKESSSTSGEARSQEQEHNPEMEIWKAMEDQGIYLSSDDDFEDITTKLEVLDQQGLDTKPLRDSLRSLSIFAKPEEIGGMLNFMFSAPGHIEHSNPRTAADTEADSRADSEVLEEYELDGMTKDEFKAFLELAPPEERLSATPIEFQPEGSEFGSAAEELPPELHLSMLRSHVHQYVSKHCFLQKNHTAPHTVSERRRFTRDVYDYARARGLSKKQATGEVHKAKQAYMRGARWRKMVGKVRITSQDERVRSLESEDEQSIDKSDSEVSALGTEIDDTEKMLSAATVPSHDSPTLAGSKNGMLSSESANGKAAAEKQKWIKSRKPMKGVDVGGSLDNGGNGRKAKKSKKHKKPKTDSSSDGSSTFTHQVQKPERPPKKLKDQSTVNDGPSVADRLSRQDETSPPAESSRPEAEHDNGHNFAGKANLSKHEMRQRRKKIESTFAPSQSSELGVVFNHVTIPKSDSMDAAVSVSGKGRDKQSQNKKKKKRKSESSVSLLQNPDQAMVDAGDALDSLKRDFASFESALMEQSRKKKDKKNKVLTIRSPPQGAKPQGAALHIPRQHIAIPENESWSEPRTNNNKSDDKAAKRERKARKKEKRRIAAEKMKQEAKATEAARAREAAEVDLAEQERREAKAKRREERKAKRSIESESRPEVDGSTEPSREEIAVPKGVKGSEESDITLSKKKRRESKQDTVSEKREEKRGGIVPSEQKGPNDPESKEQAHLNFLKANDADPHEHALTTDKTPKEREIESKKAMDFISELSDLKRFSNDKQVEAYDRGLYKNANKQAVHDIEEQREGTKQEKGIDPGTGKPVEDNEKKRKRKRGKEATEALEGKPRETQNESEIKPKKKRSKVEQGPDHEATENGGFHSPMIHQKTEDRDLRLGAAKVSSSVSMREIIPDPASSKTTELYGSLSDLSMDLPSTDLESQEPDGDSDFDYVPSSLGSSVLSTPPPSPLPVPEGLVPKTSDFEEPPSQTPQPRSDTEDFKPLSPRKRRTPKKPSRKKSALVSPYFKPTPPTTPKKKRPSAGTVSCIPFPPLSSSTFGLIQEKLANDPFRLLVAVTFLNRTKGVHAIPVFYELMERYPTPEDLANANEAEVAKIVRHLGLQNIRAKRYIALAKMWVTNPPIKGRRHRRLHYPNLGDGKNIKPMETVDDADQRVAWETAHLPTAGPYALDSWRIFCRDVLRGVARGWNGEGGVVVSGVEMPDSELKSGEELEMGMGMGMGVEEEFEPEWKRVVPMDKELRAFLRWMWLKEGWEWDPLTGRKRRASADLMDRAGRGVVGWEDDEDEDEVVRRGEREGARCLVDGVG